MTETNEYPITIHEITDTDKDLIISFTGTSGYRTFRKVMENELVRLYRSIDTAKDTDEIKRLQGRINGTRWAINVFPMTASTYLNEKKVQAEKDRAAARNPAQRTTLDQFMASRRTSGELE